ncbi:unnamed protein product [Alternaria alternata]
MNYVPSPSIARRASWDAVDAATEERRANMQHFTAAQEVQALERCDELKSRIYCKATESLKAPEPLIIPEPWVLSEATVQRLVEHPFMFQRYLELERGILDLIEIREYFLESQICKSPQLLITPQFRQEVKSLEILERRREDILASRLLVDLILEAFRHVTAKLLIDITKKDERKKAPISEACYRLIAYSTYPGGTSELITAAQNIEEMEFEYLPWRYNAQNPSWATSPTPSLSESSPVFAQKSPPADDIRTSPEQVSSLPSTEDTPLKDPTRLRVKFQDCLITRTPAVWRKIKKSLPSISSNPRNPLGKPVSQFRPQRAVRTGGRGHRRNSDMSYLTHPIVMMGLPPTPYEFPFDNPRSPEPAPTQGEHIQRPPERADFRKSHHFLTPSIGQRSTSTRPEAAHTQDAWSAATGSKRRANDEIRPADYGEPKKARVSNSNEACLVSRDDGIDSVDRTQEDIKYAGTEDGDRESVGKDPPPSKTPTRRMAVALAIAQAKRDAKYTKERSCVLPDIWDGEKGGGYSEED